MNRSINYKQIMKMKLHVVCFSFVIILYLMYISNSNDSSPKVAKLIHQQSIETPQTQKDLDINSTHINGILIEPINVDYTRNIYFTIKTTHKYYTMRLLPLLLTWLQLVDKNKLSIITDTYQLASSKQIFVDMMRRAGYHIIDSIECQDGYNRIDLCCKMGVEFAAYYKALEEHPGEDDKYQWYCHSDDDVYINIPQLSQFLQQYDPQKPHYIGKWPQKFFADPYYPLKPKTIVNFAKNINLPLKKTKFQYATGSTFCVSHAIMMEAKRFMNGARMFSDMSRSAYPRLPDDMTVGLVISALLGYNFTNVANFTNQYDDYVRISNLKELISYLTVSSGAIAFSASLNRFASSSNTTLLSADPTRFLVYHCLLYPTVSWCSGVRELIT